MAGSVGTSSSSDLSSDRTGSSDRRTVSSETSVSSRDRGSGSSCRKELGS
jgi:hypothetical protein